MECCSALHGGQNHSLNWTWWHIATISALGMLRQEDEEFNDSLGYSAMTILTIAISKFYAEKEEKSLEQKPRKQKANSQKGLFGPNF